MKQLAFGTTLKWNDEYVGGIENIGGVEITVETVDVTTHDSADGFREWLASLLTASDVPVSGFFDSEDSTGQLAMLTDAVAKTSRTGVITFPNSAASWTFTGIITSIKIGDSPVDGAIPFSATIKITGKPVFAVGVSTGLSGLTVSNSAVLIPAFANGTTEYVATVLTGVSSVTITPTASAGVITVNGSTVTSGQASSSITLGSAGSVTEVEVVVTETGKTAKTYTVRIARA